MFRIKRTVAHSTL